MTTPTLPPTWRTSDVHPTVMARLHTLWRLATTSEQQWELERLVEDMGTTGTEISKAVEAESLEDSVSEIRDAIYDLKRAIRDIERIKKLKPS